MTISKDTQRQYPLFAMKRFSYADLTSGAQVQMIDLPGGAVILDGGVVIETAFNSATSDALVVGDSNGANVLKSSFSIASTGRTALTPAGGAYPAKDSVRMTWTGSGTAPSAGAGFIWCRYAIEGRQNEVQP